MGIDWAVTIHPRWRRARGLLLVPLLPFYALRWLCLQAVPRGQALPNWMQAVLLVPGLLFLGLPTRLYQLLGIVKLVENP